MQPHIAKWCDLCNPLQITFQSKQANLYITLRSTIIVKRQVQLLNVHMDNWYCMKFVSHMDKVVQQVKTVVLRCKTWKDFVWWDVNHNNHFKTVDELFPYVKWKARLNSRKSYHGSKLFLLIKARKMICREKYREATFSTENDMTNLQCLVLLRCYWA